MPSTSQIEPATTRNHITTTCVAEYGHYTNAMEVLMGKSIQGQIDQAGLTSPVTTWMPR